MAEAKKYTFVGMHKGNTEGTAVGYLEGWVVRDAEKRDGNGKDVTNSALALNNVAKKLSYVLGQELPVTDSTFVEIAGWEQLAGRMEKVVKKGNLIGVSGVLKTREYNGKTQLTFTVQDFKVVKFADSNSHSQSQSSSNGSSQTNGQGIDVSDDDLPF